MPHVTLSLTINLCFFARIVCRRTASPRPRTSCAGARLVPTWNSHRCSVRCTPLPTSICIRLTTRHVVCPCMSYLLLLVEQAIPTRPGLYLCTIAFPIHYHALVRSCVGSSLLLCCCCRIVPVFMLTKCVHTHITISFHNLYTRVCHISLLYTHTLHMHH